MIEWLKGLFKSPKTFIKLAVDSLDLAVPYLASEIEKIKGRFNAMTSAEQAQMVIDRIQLFLIDKFKLDA